jgi:Bacterial Ig-like domain (group 3)
MTRLSLLGLKMISPSRGRHARNRSGKRTIGLEALEDRRLMSGATVYTVNSTSSSSTGTGDSGTLPYIVGQANANPNAAGSEIEFDPTVFTGSPAQRITLTSVLELSETAGPEVIDGPGSTAVTVSGNVQVQIFQIDSGVTATIEGLGLVNGSGKLGGCVSNAGTLTMSNCLIIGGGAVDGGGIYNAGTMTLTNGTVNANQAQYGDGDGIYNAGMLTVENTTVTQDEALSNAQGGGDGGGIYNAGTLILDKTSVSQDDANDDGGSVYIAVGTVTITDCPMSYNQAQNDGGAIFNKGGDVQVSGTGGMASNAVDGDGGDIYNSAGTLAITGVDMGARTASDGGGIYVKSGTVTLTDSDISGCTATGDGGGVFNAGNLNLIKTEIGANHVTGSSDGGGLYNDGGVVNASSGSEFYGNSAGGDGGGVYNLSGTIAISGSTVESNAVSQGEDGAGIYNLATITLTDTTVTKNGAGASGDFYTSEGGAIFSSGTLTISGGNLDENTAGEGGGIENSGMLTITGATIQSNAAGSTSGGGVHNLTAGTVAISDSTLINNDAAGGGGGIANDGAATVTNCTFTENLADGGAGVENTGSLTAVSTTIYYNWTNGGAGSGGGLSGNSGSTNLYDTIVADNQDGYSGSGSADDIAGTVSGSHNLIGAGGSGGLTDANGNQVGVTDVYVGSPNNYGGDTETYALLPGSPAIGAGSADIPGITVPTTDQRGVTRPSNSVDIGSFQDQGFTITVAAGGSPQTALINTAFTNRLSVNVSSAAGDPIVEGIVTFSTPSSGASATLSTESAIIYDDEGDAYVTATADGTVGSYNVAASTTGAPSSVLFALTNQPSTSSLLSTMTSLASSINPSTYGRSVTFTASVRSASGSGAPTGSVVFTIDGQSQPPTTLSVVDGVDEATVSMAALAAGSHTITAAYSGDASFAASAVTTALTQTVNTVSPAATSIRLTSSANPSTIDQSVGFTAIVAPASGSGAPTGTVVFTIDGHAQPPVALSVVDGVDEATASTASLTAGPHIITASYSGDTSFAPSVATSDLTQTVNKAALKSTTTTLTSPSELWFVGETVVFTATVAASAGSGTPTGSVSFAINGKAGSTVPLTAVNSEVEATFSVPVSAAGSYTITAFYSGDPNFAPSGSSTTAQVTAAVILPYHTSIDGPTIVSVLRYGYHMMPTTVVLAFDQALNATAAQDDANYRIIGPGGRVIGIKSAEYNPVTLTVTLRPRQRISIHKTYKLIVDGTEPHGLTDTAGLLLDGTNDGRAGGDYRAPLTWRNLVLDPPWPKKSHVPKVATGKLKRE